jgi:HAMP domain-containing protein
LQVETAIEFLQDIRAEEGSPSAGLIWTHPARSGAAPVAVGHDAERGKAARPRKRAGSQARNGAAASKNGAGNGQIPQADLKQLLGALEAARDGDFRVRLPVSGKGISADLHRAFNELADRREAFSKEVARVGRAIGREGRLTDRAHAPAATGHWADTTAEFNTLIDDLVRPTTEVARVIDAVADGDLSQKMQLTIEGQPVKGEFRRIGTTVNAMVDQLSSFADEVTRVASQLQRVQRDRVPQRDDLLRQSAAGSRARVVLRESCHVRNPGAWAQGIHWLHAVCRPLRRDRFGRAALPQSRVRCTNSL